MSLCIITKCCSFLSCNCGGLVSTIHLVHSWLTQLHDTHLSVLLIIMLIFITMLISMGSYNSACLQTGVKLYMQAWKKT